MKYRFLSVFLVLLTAVNVFSQEARYALLIANGTYAKFTSLSQPVPEAHDLKAVLEKLDFTVTLVENANLEEMTTSLREFKTRIKTPDDIAFFHYGGHAVQIDGKNYLIPSDADIPEELYVKTRALNVDEVMFSMEAETNIVILDSCRNNPLPGSERSATRGLTVLEVKPKNSIVVYSAQAGNVAQDGVFTPILTKNLASPNISFSDVLMKVRREVLTATNNVQSPGDYSELVKPVYLAGSGRVTPTVTNIAPPVHERSAATGSLEITSEIAGDLYLDGSQYGSIRAGGVQTIANLETGKWTVEVKGANETLKTEATVLADETSKAILAIPKKPVPSIAATTENEASNLVEVEAQTPSKFKLGIKIDVFGSYSNLQIFNINSLHAVGFGVRVSPICMFINDILTINTLTPGYFFSYAKSKNQYITVHELEIGGVCFEIGKRFVGIVGVGVSVVWNTYVQDTYIFDGVQFFPTVGFAYKFNNYISLTAEYKLAINPFIQNTPFHLKHEAYIGLSFQVPYRGYK